MTLYKNVDGVDFPLTDEEVAQYEQREAEWQLTSLDRAAATFITILSAHLDTKASERRYTSAISCSTYINSSNEKWAAEALAFKAWRDAFLQAAYTYQAEVQQGLIPNPSFADFLTNAPALIWP